MSEQERKKMIVELADHAKKKLGTIRRMAVMGGPVQNYHFLELSEILTSLRHHTEMQARDVGMEVRE